MTAETILSVLSKKHNQDVFVPGCKNGPTWFNDHLRIMDAWVMKRSWSNLHTWAYEIKVSRGDFLSDSKWTDYLQYCHEFYFVCPWGMIKTEEIEAPAGLMYVTNSGKTTRIKKHAIKRDIEIPIELLIHILMSRAVISRPDEIDMLRHRVKHLEAMLKRKEHDNQVHTQIP